MLLGGGGATPSSPAALRHLQPLEDVDGMSLPLPTEISEGHRGGSMAYGPCTSWYRLKRSQAKTTIAAAVWHLMAKLYNEVC
jgi:hypothetical protein